MSWQKVKLGQFLKNREGRYKPNDKTIQGLKRIDKINFSGTIFLSDKPSNTDMILVKKGDLIISGINVEKGAMNIYQGDEDVVATIHYSSYEFDEEKIDIDFLTNFLKSLEFKNALKEQVPGGIKTEIKPKHILPLIVEIPTDVKEQKRIVKKLIENNSIINKASFELSYQLDLIKQLRQAFLREAMQGKLVKSTNTKETGQQLLEKIKAEKAQLIAEKKLKKEKKLSPITDYEIPFEIPEHWAWCKLGDVVNEILGGYAFDSTKYSKTETDNQVIRLGNVKPNKLVLDSNPVFINGEYANEANKSMLKVGDILITMTGTRAKRDYLFSLCLFEDDFKTKNLFLNQRVGCFRFPELISTNFINVLLKDSKLIEPIFESSTGAANQANIGITALRETILPLPPLHEQEQIVAKLEELMAFCDGLEESIKDSQVYNEKLLQQVLREALQPKEEV